MITMLDRAITPEAEDRSTSPIQMVTPEPDLHAYTLYIIKVVPKPVL